MSLPSSPSPIEIRGAGGLILRGDAWGPPGGAPVVFLHGGGQTRHAWGTTAQRFARAGAYVLAMDHRGHGDSDWPAPGALHGDYDLETFAGDVRAIATHLGRPPAVVGASLGGMAALLANGTAPNGDQVFSALVLVDITPRIDSDGVAKIQGFMRAQLREGFGTIAEAADAVAAYLPHRPRPRSHEGLKKNLRLHPDGRWRWHWDPRFLEGNRRIGPGSAEVEQMLVGAARRIAIPTLLVRGASSELVGEEHAKDFLKLVPHARYVDVTGARHMVAGDRNDQFANAIESFLNELRIPS